MKKRYMALMAGALMVCNSALGDLIIEPIPILTVVSGQTVDLFTRTNST
jgi:hypothetical protein